MVRIAPRVSTPRTTVTVQRETHEILSSLEDVLRVSKTDLVGALAEWFKQQPRQVQSAIIDKRGDAAAELAKIKLAEMAAAGGIAGSEIPADVSQACELIRKLADKVERAYENMEHVAEKATKKKI